VTIALDSWAVLRLLEGSEPAASRVQDLLDEQQPVMSWINLGEVLYIVSRDQGREEGEQVLRDLRPLLRLDLPTEQRVLEAARIKAEYPLAYADAFAAATALAHDATLWTGDPELLLEDAPWSYEDLRGANRR
jgi:predicted nucleic acid-binding protein